jgi:hypothetical protein
MGILREISEIRMRKGLQWTWPYGRLERSVRRASGFPETGCPHLKSQLLQIPV